MSAGREAGGERQHRGANSTRALRRASASSTSRRAGRVTGREKRRGGARTVGAPEFKPAGTMGGARRRPARTEVRPAPGSAKRRRKRPARADRRAFVLAGPRRPARDRRKAQAARAGPRESREKMRIVGGRLKGRVLLAPSSRAIRPTSERLRESIFDILEHRFPGHIEGARVVDLFAGSGALAIEALSRGARFALFVDNGAEARAVLRANVEALALGGVTRIWRADATRLGSAPAGGPFALAFLDPPYGHGLAGPALASLVEGGWLEPNALCVVEEAAKADIVAPVGLARVDERIYGDTRIVIFEARALQRRFDFARIVKHPRLRERRRLRACRELLGDIG